MIFLGKKKIFLFLVIYRRKYTHSCLYMRRQRLFRFFSPLFFSANVEAYFRIKHFIPVAAELSASFNPKCRLSYCTISALSLRLPLFKICTTIISAYLIVIGNYCGAFETIFEHSCSLSLIIVSGMGIHKKINAFVFIAVHYQEEANFLYLLLFTLS